MRSPYISLLLVVLVGLSIVAGARLNRARQAAAVETQANPVQMDIQLWKLDLNGLRQNNSDSPVQAQPSLTAATDPTPAAPIKNIRIMCPNAHCRHIIVVPETVRGTIVKCSSCELLFRIPEKPPEGAKN